jgi:hypothetical protein
MFTLGVGHRLVIIGLLIIKDMDNLTRAVTQLTGGRNVTGYHHLDLQVMLVVPQAAVQKMAALLLIILLQNPQLIHKAIKYLIIL